MRFRPFPALVALLLAACGPAAPPAPVATQPNRSEAQRAEFFGAAVAADALIAWRPTGLGLKILAPGEGAAPGLSDRVRFRYVGRLKDGTVFDQSPANHPAEFKLAEMIPGMTAGVGALRPGGRALVYVPPSLGYGGMRRGKIPPVSGLIFEIELVGVVP